MGLLGRVFGLDKKGKISLTVDKSSYIAGELVVGTISVTVYEDIECDAVVVKATGKEKVKWTEEKTETNAEGQAKIVVSSIPHIYTPGNYTYRFEYPLPPDLPGVFKLSDYAEGNCRDVDCKISYKLKATLDVQGSYAKDLKAKCELVVHERLTQTIQLSHDSTSQQVNFLCCFNKGTCHLDVAIDKNVYLAGETAQILCKIQNGSQVDITAMSCRLLQDIELRANSRAHKFTRELCRQTFPGVPASSELQQPQPLPLVPNVRERAVLNASTSGRLVSCAYRVDIECAIPWCPDVHLRMPLTIVAPVLAG